MKLKSNCRKNWLLTGTVVLILCFTIYTVYKENDLTDVTPFSMSNDEYSKISYVANELRKNSFEIKKVNDQNKEVIFSNKKINILSDFNYP